jgi:hypothetical protein
VKPTATHPAEPDYGHYHTAGIGLIIIGLINSAVALYSIIQGSQNVFIDYEMMLTFAVSFTMIGAWMRSL